MVYLGSAAAADNNTILVFAAGNDGWNNETGIVDLFDSTDSTVRSGTALASEIAAESSANISSANRIDTATAMPTYAPDNSSYVIDEAENEYMWLVVVATDDNDTITHFSNACGVAKSYCLAAPGEDIFATNGLNSPAYQTLDGTSMAAPHVTGAIAILADMYPNLVNTPENITQILLETATDLGATGVDDIYGHGLLNLQAATGPLGDITITDSSFGASSQTYDGNAQIITPIAFGDALTKTVSALVALINLTVSSCLICLLLPQRKCRRWRWRAGPPHLSLRQHQTRRSCLATGSASRWNPLMPKATSRGQVSVLPVPGRRIIWGFISSRGWTLPHRKHLLMRRWVMTAILMPWPTPPQHAKGFPSMQVRLRKTAAA